MAHSNVPMFGVGERGGGFFLQGFRHVWWCVVVLGSSPQVVSPVGFRPFPLFPFPFPFAFNTSFLMRIVF